MIIFQSEGNDGAGDRISTVPAQAITPNRTTRRTDPMPRQHRISIRRTKRLTQTAARRRRACVGRILIDLRESLRFGVRSGCRLAKLGRPCLQGVHERVVALCDRKVRLHVIGSVREGRLFREPCLVCGTFDLGELGIGPDRCRRG